MSSRDEQFQEWHDSLPWNREPASFDVDAAMIEAQKIASGVSPYQDDPNIVRDVAEKWIQALDVIRERDEQVEQLRRQFGDYVHAAETELADLKARQP